MTDLDERLSTAFADFRHRVGPLVRPDGTDRAQATVRTRRRRRMVTAAGALALVAVGVPAGGFATATGSDRAPTPAASPSRADLKISEVPRLYAFGTPLTFVSDPAGGYRGTAQVAFGNYGKSAGRYQATIQLSAGLEAVEGGGCRPGTTPRIVVCTGTIEALSSRIFTVGFASAGHTGHFEVLSLRRLRD